MIAGRYVEKQHVWEWLALGNFLMGGAGGGLYVTAHALALYTMVNNLELLSLLSITLVIAGLLCVMAEAGKPSRAMGVIRNLRTSWMSREALFASGFIILAALDTLILQNMILRTIAWVSALGYVVCQSFMLAASKKIPAWNTPATAPLFITLSIATGAGIISMINAAEVISLIDTLLAIAVLVVGASYAAWPGATEYFRQALRREGNITYLAAGLLIVTLAIIPTVLHNNQLAAGLLLIAGTSVMKYTIIIRMSYKLPVLPPLEAWH